MHVGAGASKNVDGGRTQQCLAKAEVRYAPIGHRHFLYVFIVCRGIPLSRFRVVLSINDSHSKRKALIRQCQISMAVCIFGVCSYVCTPPFMSHLHQHLGKLAGCVGDWKNKLT